MSNSFIRSSIIAIPIALAVGVVVGMQADRIIPSSTAASNTPTVLHETVAGIAKPADFSGIVDQYGPAVVNISVTGKAQPVQRFPGFPGMSPDDPFFHFFQQFGPQFQQAPERVVPHGLGSGFIVTQDGLVMTNAHVINDAEEVVVKLTDRREFRAKVLGADRRSDVAVLKIEAKNLPTVILGDPSLTKVGEPVLAIGSPFGFENSATAGIVSAKSRTLPDDPYVSLMQTDVAVNPGNSGGPLFNLRGEVIGINSQIYTQTGGYQGLSFAIPIDIANKVREQLVQHGKVTRGRLGLSIQDVNQDLAESFGLDKAAGALVAAVEKDSPAEKAGLQNGDVITAVDGHAINRSQELTALISETTPGTKVQLELIRGKSKKVIVAKVGEMNQANEIAKTDDSALQQEKLGVAVRPMNANERKADQAGLVVTQSRGAAAKAGIRSGDIILSLNDTPVADPEQFKQLVQKAGPRVALLIRRGDMHQFVAINLG